MHITSHVLSLLTSRSNFQNSTWGPPAARCPCWRCPWRWRPKPASGSWPPGCWQTCVGLCWPAETWRAPLTNCSGSCLIWSWIHLEPLRWVLRTPACPLQAFMWDCGFRWSLWVKYLPTPIGPTLTEQLAPGSPTKISVELSFKHI